MEVTVLYGDNCPACDTLKGFLRDSKIGFKSYHRESEEGRELVEKYGITGIPFTIMKKDNMEQHFVGSRTRSILETWKNATGRR